MIPLTYGSVTTPLLSALFVCFFLSPCVVSFFYSCLFLVPVLDIGISSARPVCVVPPVSCLLGSLILQRAHIVS